MPTQLNSSLSSFCHNTVPSRQKAPLPTSPQAAFQESPEKSAPKPINLPSHTRTLATPRIPTAIYCRVSTTHPHQQESLENQITHYQDFMKNNPQYSLAKIYYDFGISGYKEERPGFSQMLKDAQDGHFRQIITKSITRFARNTLDCINYTRILRQLGIGVLFEKENVLIGFTQLNEK